MVPLGRAPARSRAKDRPLARAAIAIAASFAVNGVALRLAAPGLDPGARSAGPAPVALAPLPAGEWRQNREIRPPEPPERAGRVVELDPEQPASAEPPDASRFLSDRNTRVERETVARDAGRPRGSARAPGASAGTPRAGRGEPLARAGPPAGRPRRPAGRPLPPDGGLAPRPGPPDAPPAGGPGGPGGGAGGRPDLRLHPEALERIAGGGGMDVLPEVEEGDATLLSSREFRFATFLNQMRREIGEAWYPRVEAVVGEPDPGTRALFHRDRTVVLALTLGERGELRALSVLESSQVEAVDAIAIAAVREAQPFPNPPRAMFERGEARIPFAFTIYPAERRGLLRWRAPEGR